MDKREFHARVRTGAKWYDFRNSVGDTTDIVIYDEIGWFGVTAAAFIEELSAVTTPKVSLRLSSPGGEIFDGIAVMNALRSHAAHVTVYVDSLAASIASVIAMAGDRIVMQPHSQLMIHDGSGLCVGNAADMREMAELLDRQSDNIAAIYAERAGGTVRQWRERMRAETWYTDTEAVAAGLADEVAKMERQETEPALAAKWDLTVFNYAGRDAAPAPDTSRLVGERDGSVSEPAPPPTPPAATPATPVPAAAFDPELLRAALTDAVEKPFAFDADDFRASLTAITSEAAAVTPQPEPEDDDDPEPVEDDEEPEEQSAGDVLAEALQALTEDAPAETAPADDEPLPDPPPPPPPPPPDEAPSIADIWREHFAPVMAAGIGIAANNAPAPPEPDPEPEPEPVAFDAVAFTNALKEAARG